MIAPYLSWVYVVGGIPSSSLAQICMKRATLFESNPTSWLLYISGSLLCYVLSFGAYYLALRHFAISKISPVMTVGVVLIVVVYGMWTGEIVTLKHALGLFLGAVAIFLILS